MKFVFKIPATDQWLIASMAIVITSSFATVYLYQCRNFDPPPSCSSSATEMGDNGNQAMKIWAWNHEQTR